MTQQLFDSLIREVTECAEFACNNQTKIHLSYKYDGSVLTETDLAVSERLSSFIAKAAPNCNIVSEESPTGSFIDGAPYTFVLDPIDGTDSYSQGLDTWCVSLGILDSSLEPCGAIIVAPRFGASSASLTVTTFPGSEDVYVNGRKAVRYSHNSIPRQLSLGSDTLKHIDMRAYKGKIRSYGSSIIHLLCPVVYFNIDACVDPVCFPWDIASSYAVIRKMGMRLVYTDGTEVRFTKEQLVGKLAMDMDMFAGYDDCIGWMMNNLIPFNNSGRKN